MLPDSLVKTTELSVTRDLNTKHFIFFFQFNSQGTEYWRQIQSSNTHYRENNEFRSRDDVLKKPQETN